MTGQLSLSVPGLPAGRECVCVCFCRGWATWQRLMFLASKNRILIFIQLVNPHNFTSSVNRTSQVQTCVLLGFFKIHF